METPAITTRRHDALDTERFADMLDSPPFAMFMQRIEAEFGRSRLDCENETEAVPLHRAQGRCAAYRTVLALPAIMRAEQKKGLT